MENHQPQYVRFDWAMKRLLRDKANYGMLEGFLTTLLEKKIKIQKMLEGESNQDVYHGKTEFRGVHNGELLSLSPFQRQTFHVSAVSDLCPEYYILKVNDFNKWSKVPLEQWIYLLNTADIPHDASAPGLDEARQKLRLSQKVKPERDAYYRHLDNVTVLKDNFFTARGEGQMEATLSLARKMRAKGMEVSLIADLTGLGEEDIAKL